jgi:hypothetical protein
MALAAIADRMLASKVHGCDKDRCAAAIVEARMLDPKHLTDYEHYQLLLCSHDRYTISEQQSKHILDRWRGMQDTPRIGTYQYTHWFTPYGEHSVRLQLLQSLQRTELGALLYGDVKYIKPKNAIAALKGWRGIVDLNLECLFVDISFGHKPISNVQFEGNIWVHGAAQLSVRLARKMSLAADKSEEALDEVMAQTYSCANERISQSRGILLAVHDSDVDAYQRRKTWYSHDD